jgi:mycolipenoyl-CoA---2-(long-chain-fatty acyl)-trehalose mycolipenoyltransferase / long-chain-acyl-CoA---trehalose acyltransferase
VKDLAQVPMPRVAELLGQPLRDPFMVSYSDFRRTPGARHWNTWRTVVLRSRCTDPDEVCLWIVRGRDGLVVSYRHPATDQAGIAVPHYVARAKQLLVSVASTSHWPTAPTDGEHRQ